MTLYEYQCPNGHQFDAFVPMDQREQPYTCPRCQSQARRVISLSPIIVRHDSWNSRPDEDPHFWDKFSSEPNHRLSHYGTRKPLSESKKVS